MNTALTNQAKIIEMIEYLATKFSFEERNLLKDFYFELGVQSVKTESKQKGNLSDKSHSP